MKTGFIGAGKVGFTLGKFFVSKGNKVTGYYSRNTHSAQAAATFTDTTAYDSIAELIEDSDALFLTVPDGCITSVYEEIRRYPIRGKYICHCSGALSSEDAFPGIGDTGAYEYSVHPLFAVSDKTSAYRELGDVFFTVEGNQSHIGELRFFLEEMGLKTRTIDPGNKTLYHASAAMASNLVVGLMAQCVSMLGACGFPEEEALAALRPLVQGNVEHIFSDGLAASLTGPVERGDSGTIRKHLAVLESDEEKRLYKILSGRALALAEQKHPERSYDSIKAVIQEERQED